MFHRLGTLAICGALAGVVSCLDPTEVTLVLTTDVPCSQLKGTSITVGSASEVETKNPKAPVTVTSLCDPTGTDHDIGTFVVIPHSSSSEAFAVLILSGVDKPVADCTSSDNYRGCIAERRELSFVPHTSLTLPLPMDIDCLNVSCETNLTCRNGQCVSPQVPHPSTCTDPKACGPGVLPIPDGGSPIGDGSADAGADVAAPDATAPVDATMDVPSSDAGATDAAPFDVSSPDEASDVLGSCVQPGSSTTGVACAGGTCPSGQVCCIAWPPRGGPSTETCSNPAACDVDAGGSVRYSSFACRNWGDCPTNTVCCAAGSGNGFVTSCTSAASCPVGLSIRPACRNPCECGTLTCVATTCNGAALGVCTPSLAVCP